MSDNGQDGCRERIWPSWAPRWIRCGSAVNPETGRCAKYDHKQPGPAVGTPIEEEQG